MVNIKIEPKPKISPSVETTDKDSVEQAPISVNIDEYDNKVYFGLEKERKKPKIKLKIIRKRPQKKDMAEPTNKGPYKQPSKKLPTTGKLVGTKPSPKKEMVGQKIPDTTAVPQTRTLQTRSKIKPTEASLKTTETNPINTLQTEQIESKIKQPKSIANINKSVKEIEYATPTMVKITAPAYREIVQNKTPYEFVGESGVKPEQASHVEGIELPEIVKEDVKLEELEETDLKTINIKYPLIPAEPKKGEKIFAWAEIRWSHKSNELEYIIHEPELTEEEKNLIEDIKAFIEEKTDINFNEIRKKEALDYIVNIFNDALEYFRVYLTKEKREIFKYYIFRDYIGLGILEPFLNDEHLEDISCDGAGIPIYIYHRDPRLGSLRTNVFFENEKELENFVIKLSEKCGKSISVAKPLLDGALPDGSRVQATLKADVAMRGSNFTIRKFTKNPLTPTDLLKYGTIDLTTMSYFWLAIEHGLSVLVSGGTATGKTSMLNVLSLFIKPSEKIVSIEDTPELRLSHPHWISEVSRTSIATEKEQIDLFELLKESLRQRPDYIIVGEVRGAEAYVLFQQMATGHAGLSTIHAEDFPKLLDRLSTKPIELPISLVQNLDIIVFLKRIKQKKRYIRRVDSVVEVIGFDREKNIPIVNNLLSWNPRTDKFDIINKSYILKKICEKTNMNEEEIRKEIKQRAVLLKWMVEKNITDYKKVVDIINLYYSYGSLLIDKISES